MYAVRLLTKILTVVAGINKEMFMYYFDGWEVYMAGYCMSTFVFSQAAGEGK